MVYVGVPLNPKPRKVPNHILASGGRSGSSKSPRCSALGSSKLFPWMVDLLPPHCGFPAMTFTYSSKSIRTQDQGKSIFCARCVIEVLAHVHTELQQGLSHNSRSTISKGPRIPSIRKMHVTLRLWPENGFKGLWIHSLQGWTLDVCYTST